MLQCTPAIHSGRRLSLCGCLLDRPDVSVGCLESGYERSEYRAQKAA